MLGNLDMKKLTKQFIQFGMVGVVNTLASIAIFEFVNVPLGINYDLSNTISYIVGAAVSFSLNKIWTFKSKGAVLKEAFVFFMVFIPCFFIERELLIFLVEKMNLNETLGFLLATGFYTVINFLGHRFITFRKAQTLE